MRRVILNNLTKKEIVDLLKDDSQTQWIFDTADGVRKQYVGDNIHLRALIEFSNICKNNCLYCGLRCANKNVERYRLTEEEIISHAQKAVELGYKTIVLQGGEDDFYSKDILCKIISQIKNFDVAVTLSLGEKTFEELKAFKDAGADRYLLRIETTDKNLYNKMHPYMDYNNRIKCLENIKKLGYEVGTGCLVGLPNQTFDSLAEDILFFKEIEADMIGIGPLITHPQTPLKDECNGDFNLSLKVMALTRILLKDINIPATTAMETLVQNGRILALQSGANVIMPNITDFEVRKKYEIYPNKNTILQDLQENKSKIESLIKSIGRTVSNEYGFRKGGKNER